jgi:hypothetical protein
MKTLNSIVNMKMFASIHQAVNYLESITGVAIFHLKALQHSNMGKNFPIALIYSNFGFSLTFRHLTQLELRKIDIHFMILKVLL